jgi:uncharacterized protein YndB with AHSA1/START domain
MAKKAAKKRFGSVEAAARTKAAPGRRAPKPAPTAKRTRPAKTRPVTEPVSASSSAAATPQSPPAPLKPAAQIETIELEVSIAAPIHRVWDALVNELSSWWPKSFHALANAELMTLEARAGGRLFERSSDGAELLWAHVLHIQPNKTLTTVGFIAPPWGGPSMGIVTYNLRENGPATVVRVTDAIVGRCERDTADSMVEGWRFLLEQGLRKYIESDLAGDSPQPDA